VQGQPDQSIRIGVRDWPREYGVEYAEDRRVHADAHGERQHHGGGEAGVPAQYAEAVAAILDRLLEPHGNPHGTGVLLRQRDAAEREHRLVARVVG
jgi:hypothetical protein